MCDLDGLKLLGLILPIERKQRVFDFQCCLYLQPREVCNMSEYDVFGIVVVVPFLSLSIIFLSFRYGCGLST